MRRSKWILLSAFIFAFSCLQTMAAQGSGTETVGRFAFRVLRALGRQPADQAVAVKALRKAGVDLGENVGAPLTQGRAAGILRGLGIKVADPGTPDAAVTDAQATRIVTAVTVGAGNLSRTLRPLQTQGCHASTADPEDCDDQGGDDDGDHGGGGDDQGHP